MDRTNKLIVLNIIPVLLFLCSTIATFETVFDPEEFAFGNGMTSLFFKNQTASFLSFLFIDSLFVGMIYSTFVSKWKLYWVSLCLLISFVIIVKIATP